MLITVDKERGCDPVAVVHARRERPPQGVPVAARGPTKLWAAATVLSLVASGVAMARIAGFDFTLGLGQPLERIQLERQLPYGRGMWLWQPQKSEGGDARAIVARAKAVGLSHLYVRTGSTWDGFYAGPFLDRILPAAHTAGIRVYGWDFPRLIDPADDVQRAVAAVTYETPGGHRIDGFAADIETFSEGTHITAEAATAYGDALRSAVGDGYPLIACVPRPSSWTTSIYPYAEVVNRFDAIAPMVYWLNRQPDTDVEGALRDLSPLGKPVFPVGQAFDGEPEGGRPGPPPPDELIRFLRVAQSDGAQGVSFWSWQAASDEVWETIRDAPQFKHGPKPAPHLPLPIRQPVVLEAG